MAWACNTTPHPTAHIYSCDTAECLAPSGLPHSTRTHALLRARREGGAGSPSQVTDPEAKRKIIGHTFIEVFEVEAKSVGDAEFLLQGTLYPDVIESISFKGRSIGAASHTSAEG